MSVLLHIFSRSPFDLLCRIIYGSTSDWVLHRTLTQLTPVTGMLSRENWSNSQCSDHKANLQLLQLIINTI